MHNSASGVGSREVPKAPNVSQDNLSSKLKTYGFIIAIIAAISGLAIGAVGLAGYCQVGALSNMAQLDAMIMMVAGGGGGAILLIIGLVGTIKNRQRGSHHQQHNSVSSGSGDIGVHKFRDSVYGPNVYGAEAWKAWKNIEVVGVVPPPPIHSPPQDKILLYMPQRIKVNGIEKDLTLITLREISGIQCMSFNALVEDQIGDRKPASGKWVLMDKKIIDDSRGKDYDAQERMVKQRDCTMPTALEAVVLNLMVYDLTGELMYGEKTWIRCLEKVNGEFGQYSVTVGFDSEGGFFVSHDRSQYHPITGVAGVQRNFRGH